MKWISVTERTPELLANPCHKSCQKSAMVIIYSKEGICMGTFKNHSLLPWQCLCDDDTGSYHEDVTHWCPLPEKPE